MLQAALTGGSAETTFTIPWDTAKATYGDHVLKATVTDGAGQTATVETKVKVDQPLTLHLLFCPSAALTGCAIGLLADVKGTVHLQAKPADDNGKFKSVTFHVGAAQIAEKMAEPYTHAWDSTTVADGKHTIAATVLTADGLTKTASFAVTVNNCDTDKDGFLASGAACKGKDCNDGDAAAFPGAADSVGDGVDTSCDGIDGLDGDLDGYASVASGGKDCDDKAASVHPCADDVADDTIDANCDGKDLQDCNDCQNCTADAAVGLKCTHVAIAAGGPCDDGNPCTTDEKCAVDACGGGKPNGCDDSLTCTLDACDPLKGCTHAANASACDDGKPCTAETCDVAKGCSSAPAAAGTACPAGVCDTKGTCTPSNVPAGMVFVPGGTFKMGCVPGDGSCYANEEPRHIVVADALFFDQYEVTVEQYGACVKAGKCTPTADKWGDFQLKKCNAGAPGKEKHPINCIDWTQSDAYCKFAGKRLPTEAEWEYAARGGLEGKLYPWGDAEGCEFAVWQSAAGKKEPGCDGSGTMPVGSKPAGKNGYGLYDMAGNLCEWVADWYDGSFYAKSPTKNPVGPGEGTFRTNRGGTFFYSAEGLRASLRFHDVPQQFFDGLGFRCAKSLN